MTSGNSSPAKVGGIDRNLILAEARDWIGTPYHHQASEKGAGCDCLGLIRGLWRCFIGPEPQSPPPYSASWAEETTDDPLTEAARRYLIEIDILAARPADILLFRWQAGMPAKHIALLTSRNAMIHAYHHGDVCESLLVPAWRRRIWAAFSFPGMAPWAD